MKEHDRIFTFAVLGLVAVALLAAIFLSIDDDLLPQNPKGAPSITGMAIGLPLDPVPLDDPEVRETYYASLHHFDDQVRLSITVEEEAIAPKGFVLTKQGWKSFTFPQFTKGRWIPDVAVAEVTLSRAEIADRTLIAFHTCKKALEWECGWKADEYVVSLFSLPSGNLFPADHVVALRAIGEGALENPTFIVGEKQILAENTDDCSLCHYVAHTKLAEGTHEFSFANLQSTLFVDDAPFSKIRMHPLGDAQFLDVLGNKHGDEVYVQAIYDSATVEIRTPPASVNFAGFTRTAFGKHVIFNQGNQWQWLSDDTHIIITTTSNPHDFLAAYLQQYPAE